MDKITNYNQVTQPFISTDYFDVSKHVTQTSGTLVIGKEYTILDFNTGDNFSNVANVVSGTINTTGCVFIATGTTPTTYSNGSTLAYYVSQKATPTQIGCLPKVYKALLTQSGTSAPVATVLVNTLSGTPVFNYNGVGSYELVLSGEFPQDKTFMYLQPILAPNTYNGFYWNDVNSLYLDIFDSAGTRLNGQLYYTSIEIEVYP